LYASLAIAAVLAIAVFDRQHAQNQVPSLTDLCGQTSSRCPGIDARAAAEGKRLDTASRLRSELKPRAWLYALVQMAVIAATVVILVRAHSRDNLRRDFRDLAVFGLCLGAITLLSGYPGGIGSSLGLTDVVRPPTLAVWAPTAMALTISAAGSAYLVLEGGASGAPESSVANTRIASTPKSQVGVLSRLPVVAVVAIAATFATVVILSFSPNVDCGGSEGVPASANVTQAIALVTACIGFVAGFTCLFFRRWVTGLSCLLLNPLLLFAVVAQTSC
jgi:hypothetical protein